MEQCHFLRSEGSEFAANCNRVQIFLLSPIEKIAVRHHLEYIVSSLLAIDRSRQRADREVQCGYRKSPRERVYEIRQSAAVLCLRRQCTGHVEVV